jgi:hypothetical protein
MAKKKGQTPPRATRMEARGKPGQIRPTVDRAKKRRKANLITAAVLFVVVGAAITAAVLTVTHKDSTLPGLSSSNAPWPAETGRLSRRLSVLDLPAFREDAQSFHNHVHLDVFVNGKATEVPGNIGNGPGFLASIHTHDATGLIHIEAERHAVFTLGDIFDVWGVRFTSTCAGAYCEPDYAVDVYVNGKKETGDLRAYAVQNLDQIAVVIGTPPETIPDTYDEFPQITPTPPPSGSATPSASPKPSPTKS